MLFVQRVQGLGANARQYGILAALIANGAFGFIRASLLMTAITTAGAAVGGYDLKQASTYGWLGQGLLGAIPLWGATEIATRVKSGEIAMDFLRPVAALGQWWAADLGRAASQVIPRLVPMLVVGTLTTGLALPRHPLPYLLFLVSLVLAVSLAFLAWTKTKEASRKGARWRGQLQRPGTVRHEATGGEVMAMDDEQLAAYLAAPRTTIREA